jgi:hypothetical protein
MSRFSIIAAERRSGQKIFAACSHGIGFKPLGESTAARLDLRRGAGQLVRTMDLPDDEQAFLRDLVKGSRQKIHLVKWVDRDGTDRQTVLTPAEAVRLNAIAQRLGTSKNEVLRQAAHIPVAK